jgi:hypothetical protein
MTAPAPLPPAQVAPFPAPVAPVYAPSATPAAPAPAKRGRKAKAANGANGAAAHAAAGEAEGPEPLELWVDCLPSKGAPDDMTAVEDWMRGAIEIAAKLAGADWRTVDYGKGAGYLFAAMSQYAATVGVPSGVVTVRSEMAGAETVIEFLTVHALRVIRGTAARR